LDFTALGDRVNIAAHLASQAAAGEILYTEDVARSAGRLVDGAERRAVALKGFELDALVPRS
jgi:class 3 adenylate cyclase